VPLDRLGHVVETYVDHCICKGAKAFELAGKGLMNSSAHAKSFWSHLRTIKTVPGRFETEDEEV
jgi:hypothetical protein